MELPDERPARSIGLMNPPFGFVGRVGDWRTKMSECQTRRCPQCLAPWAAIAVLVAVVIAAVVKLDARISTLENTVGNTRSIK